MRFASPLPSTRVLNPENIEEVVAYVLCWEDPN